MRPEEALFYLIMQTFEETEFRSQRQELKKEGINTHMKRILPEKGSSNRGKSGNGRPIRRIKFGEEEKRNAPGEEKKSNRWSFIIRIHMIGLVKKASGIIEL